MNRRKFLAAAAVAPAVADGLVGAAVTEGGALDALEHASSADDFLAARRMQRAVGFEDIWSEPEVIAESARSLREIVSAGGMREAFSTSISDLTPADQRLCAAADIRRRKLKRLKSMSEAAIDAYSLEPRRDRTL